jgi:putative MATE family efflux protein
MRRLWRIDALDRRILAISIPALGSLLVEPIYVLTDTAVVGRLGTAPLGGLALASTVLNTLVWVFNFLSYATTVRVAVRRGRGDPEGGAADALQALWLAAGIGLAVAVIVGLTASGLIGLLGDDPAVVDQGVTYLRVSVIGIPFQMVAIACIGYLYGLPDTKRPFAVLLLATTTNLVLELVLVFGLDWGIAGSAWGTVAAQILSSIVFLAIVIPRLRADGLHHLAVVPSVMWQVVKVGAHMVQRTGFLLAALAMATAAAARVGTPDLAGHQIAAQIFLLLAIGVDMFKVSGQSLVGHALGAGRSDEARDVVDHLYGWGYRAGIVLTVATLAVSPLLAWVFTDDPAVVDAARVALVVLALMQVPGAITFVTDGILMGANDFRDLRWSTTIAFAIALPVFVAVMLRPELGIVTVWFGIFVFIAARAVKNHTRIQGDQWMLSAERV